MPLSFYFTLILMGTLAWWFWKKRWRGWGIPALAVLGTVGLWYVGDVLYNDFGMYRALFGDRLLSNAWLQVAWFLVAFAFWVPRCHHWVNRRLQGRRSTVMDLVRHRGAERPSFQARLDQVAMPLLFVWLGLMAVALVRSEFDVVGLFFPYLGEKADPWARGRVGGGFDALLALATYLQVLVTAVFGVVAALSTNARTRFIALAVLALALPYFVIGRTRNTMIAVLLPGFLSWVFFRLRGGIPVKVVVMALAFVALDGWFRFVMEARGAQVSVASLAADIKAVEVDARHEGLNMFEELAWMNSLQNAGEYRPNWGRSYLAEIVNPIPRALWAGKPEVGLDYARARGFGWDQAEGAGAGVAASISTGMIGQGLANFGLVFGPPAAALLMALWVALLARQDLLARREPTRLLLFALGGVLTVNMGRDITLLVLYPFFFGLLFYHIWRHLRGKSPAEEPKEDLPTPDRTRLGRPTGRRGSVSRRQGQNTARRDEGCVTPRQNGSR